MYQNYFPMELLNNQLGSYLNYPNAMQGAMGQMWDVNQSNQQAKLYNNSLNANLGIAQMQANALRDQAAYGAYGQIGSGYMNRLTQNDLLTNPLYAEQVRGNLGTAIQELENKGLLDLERERSGQRRETLAALTGLLGNLFPGGMSVGQSGLGGFTGTGGQAAVLPNAQGAPQPGNVNQLAQMFAFPRR